MTPSTSAPSSAARPCSTPSRWRWPPATPVSPVPSRCWPTRVSPVRCPSATKSGGSMSTRRATTATAAATSFGSRGSRSMAQSPPGSTAPSRSGWSPRRCSPSSRASHRTRSRSSPSPSRWRRPPASRWGLRSPRPCSSRWPACSTAAMARSPGSPIGRPRTARSSTPCSTGRPTAFCSPARRSTSPPTPTWATCSAGHRCLLAVAVSGAALVGHLLVSYTTAKAAARPRPPLPRHLARRRPGP